MQIFAKKDDIKALKERDLHVVFTDEFLEEFYPEAYKKLKYLLALYSIGPMEFMDIFKFGNKIQEASNDKTNSYVKIIDCVVEIEAKIEPLFGILKVKKITGFIPCVLYVDYSSKWHSNYSAYNLEATSVSGLG